MNPANRNLSVPSPISAGTSRLPTLNLTLRLACPYSLKKMERSLDGKAVTFLLQLTKTTKLTGGTV